MSRLFGLTSDLSPSPGPSPVSADDALLREIATEQDAVDRAYDQLASMRESALDVVRHHQGLGAMKSGQSRVEWESFLALTDQRLRHLELGEAALAFGRIDRDDAESWMVGRLSVLDDNGEPLVIDWRAPAAEPFYRATARHPMGLVRRRHILTQGRKVTGVDDEIFDLDRADQAALGVIGEGALIAALERSRTGRMRDIVATIQTEQDEIIRGPLPGIVIVQGGPGTGKTAVALHRAAYLLYANRQRLEDSGVLVVGPNRVFLRYIEQVLPSLGEAGVELATTETLFGRLPAIARDGDIAERVKGDTRMVTLLKRAVRDRQRWLKGDLRIPYGSRTIVLPRHDLVDMIKGLRRRRGPHNEQRRAFVRQLKRRLWKRYRRMFEAMIASQTAALSNSAQQQLAFDTDDEFADDVGALTTQSHAERIEREHERFLESIGRVPEFREASERMWPALTPEEFLHDLFGARSLLRLAADGVLDADERDALWRPRSGSVAAVPWTSADLTLLDEAAQILGRPPKRTRRSAEISEDTRWMIEDVVDDIALQTGDIDPMMRRQLISHLTRAEQANLSGEIDEEPRVYGHVIVDEAQDLSAMAWRMIARRCPSGSMTIVGDLGQASRPGAIASWQDIIANVPSRREPRLTELTVNYRTPEEIMTVAAAVLRASDADLEPPTSVRAIGRIPTVVRLPSSPAALETGLSDTGLLDTGLLDSVRTLRSASSEAKVAVVVGSTDVQRIRALIDAQDDLVPDTTTAQLDKPVAVYTATDAKGLEFDAVVLVEPARIVDEAGDGLRALYVALTRATQDLVVLHTEPLPAAMVRGLADAARTVSANDDGAGQ